MHVTKHENKKTNQQESPPAWTQEAYCPPCSKYSLCCPNWVPPLGRVPPPGRVLPWAGYPPSRVPPSRVPPGQGTPLPGYPPAGPGRVLPSCPWNSGKCCKALWDTGTPPVDRQIDGWMDRRVSKHYLPVVLRTRAVTNNIQTLRNVRT